MKKAKLYISISLIALLLMIGYYVFYAKKNYHENIVINKECEILNVPEVKKEAQLIEADKFKYSSSSRDIFGKSTEGGYQIDYQIGDEVILTEQAFYGETGKTEIKYYINNGKVFYLARKNFQYEAPLYVDTSGTIQSVESREYYFNSDEELCSWFLDEKLQQIDNEIVGNINANIKTVNDTRTNFESPSIFPSINLLPPPKSCSITSLSGFANRVEAIDARVEQYSTSTKSAILEELGQVFIRFAYLDKGQKAVVFDRYSGDRGKTDITYYLENSRVFFIMKYTTSYERPLSVDSSGVIKSVKKEEYYLDEDGSTCFWFVGANAQIIDDAAINNVNLMVSSLREL